MNTGSSDETRNGRGAPGRWRFAGMELDETRGRLLAGGAEHALDHGSYGVLLALLRNAGMVVDKEALLEAGWPGRVVSENSLTKAIGRLRHLLADPEGELICTAHGYGYRLAARADWTAAGEASPPSESPVSETPTTAPVAVAPRRAPLLALLGVLALLLAAVSWLSWREARESRAVAATTAEAAPGSIADGPSIAVLPFEDLSQHHDQRYFADGLTDELLDRLAKLHQLRVASRTSTFALRGSDESVQEIARRLGVSTVLEGSVRRDGDRVRITVQLINARDGFHLWSESYDKRFTDLFAVQDDIALSVASALRVQLLPGQGVAIARHRTRSPEAYAEFMTGERLKYLNSLDNDRRAIAAYERAIALDPEFSSAYAALADMMGGDVRWADSPAEVVAAKRRSLELMDKAIQLEGDNPQWYLNRADFLYYNRRDFRAAQRDLDVAARLFRRRPPELVERQTRLLAVLGRIDEAIALDRAAVQENPKSNWGWAHLGYHLAVAGRYAEAHEALARATALKPTDDHVTYYDGLAWLLDGKPREAVAAFERSGSVFRLAGLAAAHFDAGNAPGSAQALQTLETRHAPIGAYQIAQAHAWRGETDAAFEWLERAEKQQDAGLAQLKFDPMFRRVHGDPRYRAWLVRLKLDDEALAQAL